MKPTWISAIFCIATSLALGACSGGVHVRKTQELSVSADAPYQNILVVTLMSSFDSRRNFEEEVVAQLADRGSKAVASTSRMDTRTPVTRETFVKMVEDVGADALLLTQLVSLQSEGSFVDMNPESTVIVRPTMYWNVFGVEETEYVEPQAVDFEHSLVVRSEVFSVSTRKPVWGIETQSQFKVDFDHAKDYSIIVAEARAIVASLSSDGLIAD